MLLERGKSTFLFGARGTGKTTLIDALFRQVDGVLHFDLLNPAQFQRYATRPELFQAEVEHHLAGRKAPQVVIVDEVQKLLALLDSIQALLVARREHVRFVLTGSSARKVRRASANLLAGRALTCYLHPFSSLEVDLDLGRALRFGTLPAVYLDESGLETDMPISSTAARSTPSPARRARRPCLRRFATVDCSRRSSCRSVFASTTADGSACVFIIGGLAMVARSISW